MSTEISIKQLSTVTEINNEDLLLVQTSNATNTLKYENFVIGLENTTFAPTICANSTNIDYVSSVFNDVFFEPGPTLLDGPNFIDVNLPPYTGSRSTSAAAADLIKSSFTQDTSLLPIVITNAGEKKTYYFILSAGDPVT